MRRRGIIALLNNRKEKENQIYYLLLRNKLSSYQNQCKVSKPIDYIKNRGLYDDYIRVYGRANGNVREYMQKIGYGRC